MPSHRAWAEHRLGDKQTWVKIQLCKVDRAIHLYKPQEIIKVFFVSTGWDITCRMFGHKSYSFLLMYKKWEAFITEAHLLKSGKKFWVEEEDFQGRNSLLDRVRQAPWTYLTEPLPFVTLIHCHLSYNTENVRRNTTTLKEEQRSILQQSPVSCVLRGPELPVQDPVGGRSWGGLWVDSHIKLTVTTSPKASPKA